MTLPGSYLEWSVGVTDVVRKTSMESIPGMSEWYYLQLRKINCCRVSKFLPWIANTIEDYLKENPAFIKIRESKDEESFLFSQQFPLTLTILLILLLCCILILIIICAYKKRISRSYAFSKSEDHFKDAFTHEDEFVFHKAEPQQRRETRYLYDETASWFL